jgi:ATP-dependent Lon protease
MPRGKHDTFSKSRKYNLRKKKEDPPSDSSSESSENDTIVSDDITIESTIYESDDSESISKSNNKKSKNPKKNRSINDIIDFYEKYGSHFKKDRHKEDEISCDSEDEDSEEEDDVAKKNKRKYGNVNGSNSKKNKKQKVVKNKKRIESESDDSSNSEDDDFIESDSIEFSDEDGNTEKNKLNILFSIGKKISEYSEDEIDEEHLNSDIDECDSEDEKTFMKENYHEFINDNVNNDNSKSKQKKEVKKNKKEKDAVESSANIEKEYLELVDLKKTLFDKLSKTPTNKMLKKTLNDCKKNMNSLIKSARMKNTKIYHNLIQDDNKKTNEIEYFKKKLSNKEQLEIVKYLKEINEHTNIDKPYRLSLLQSNIPSKYKAFALQKLNMLKEMSPGDSEYFKIKNWIDTFMKIPFGIYKSLSVNIKDGVEVSHKFIEDSKKTLDSCAYGHDEAKLQIMQMIGQWISNPGALGSAIAIKGPMGTGKTTLVKEGISKILGREFAFIALGGASDGSFLEGHSYTYEGSVWGRIVQILIESKCMNPVIYFDELDKISDTPKGQEIIGILTHLTDTSQNSQFHDKYFSEVDFDISKCLFIFSYNDESLVNPILKDRMYRIQTKGYDAKEKTIIAKNYLLPKIREQVNFNEGDIIIPDDTIQYLVNQQKYTKQEDGVRNLKRCLEIIYTKLNLFRLVKPESKLFSKQLDIEVTFPFTVTRKHVDMLIKVEDHINPTFLSLYI